MEDGRVGEGGRGEDGRRCPPTPWEEEGATAPWEEGAAAPCEEEQGLLEVGALRWIARRHTG
jgi:hypothetical protein